MNELFNQIGDGIVVNNKIGGDIVSKNKRPLAVKYEIEFVNKTALQLLGISAFTSRSANRGRQSKYNVKESNLKQVLNRQYKIEVESATS